MFRPIVQKRHCNLTVTNDFKSNQNCQGITYSIDRKEREEKERKGRREGGGKRARKEKRGETGKGRSEEGEKKGEREKRRKRSWLTCPNKHAWIQPRVQQEPEQLWSSFCQCPLCHAADRVASGDA